jgi:DNA-directed RNA polymerase subunit D
MEVKLLSKTKDKLLVRITDADIQYINTLRRVMGTEVPVMAIEDVEFRKNSSVLYDEIIAHRLGLMPLKTDLNSYNLPGECKCKGVGCAQCTLKLTLKTKGPKMVYAQDIKSQDPKIKPVYPKMIIAKLLDNQELAFEATAVLGQGKEHMKWSPGLIYYRFAPDIKIKKQPANAAQIVEVCPVNIFEINAKKLAVNPKKINDCILCNACVSESKDIEIKTGKDYLFFIESWGQLDAKEIGVQAVEVFNKELKELTKLISEV